MSSEIQEALLTGVIMALVAIFWLWVVRHMYRNGWRPIGWIFLVIAWQRLAFAVKWILFSRRRDKVDAFLDEAERRRRQPIAGLLDDK